MKSLLFSCLMISASLSAAEWSIHVDGSKSQLKLTSDSACIEGVVRLVSNQEQYTLVPSRDGILTRAALVNAGGNVQAYLTFPQQGGALELFFYHRTAQAFQGTLEFTGTVRYFADAFACKTRPDAQERVLAFQMRGSNNRGNDSLFSPQHDDLLQFNAAACTLTQAAPDGFSFTLRGQIHEASQARFSIVHQKDYFKHRYMPYYHAIDRTRCPKAPTGWMSWNTYFDRATAEDNLAEARIGKRYLQPFGCEFWSIESWQGNSDQLPVSKFFNMNLEVNERQFPKGMKNLADEIRALGFRPGLWTAPFGTGNTNFYTAHKTWFLHDAAGKPIKSWNGVFTLDPTVPAAREHLRRIHAIAAQEWGYEFFKIDGMSGRNHGYCAHLYERPEIRARFADPTCPNPFELCVQAFREGIGSNRVFLACQGHATGPEPRYADAARSGADIVHPNQPVKWANVKNQAICTLAQAFAHNIAMVLDPDTLLVRDLPIEEARTSATLIALPGQLTFFGDKLTNLPGEKMKILQQTLPVVHAVPQRLYPYFSLLPIWRLDVTHPELPAYTVVALFNWSDREGEVATTLNELGLDEGAYLGYEFWTQTMVPVTTQFSAVVPAHGVRVIAVQRAQKTPQWIGSDRHITTSGMEVHTCTWDPTRSVLSGKITVIGGFPLTTALHIPEGYRIATTSTTAQEKTIRQSGDLCLLTLTCEKTQEVTFDLQFEGKTK